jgi:sorbitol-specific phosphotransferase system component IIA
MPKLITAACAGFAIALTACSKAEQRDTTHDVQAAADKVGDSAKQAAQSPEVKKVGAEIKDAANDVGHVLAKSAKGAAEGARQGAAEVEGKDAPAQADEGKDAGKK